MKKNQCFIFLLFFLFFMPTVSFSQYDFREGFVITSNLDTLHGFIDYTSPDDRSQICVFKESNESQITFYKPNELSEYYVSNSTFLSKNLNISDSLGNYFVEYLVDGILNLYFLQYKGKYFYFIEKENEIHNLSNEIVEYNVSGLKKIKNSNQYIGILNWLMSDIDLRDEIYKTKFDHKSMINITKTYHNLVCDSEDCVVYYKNKRKLLDTKWQINLGLSLGLTYSNIFLTTKFNNSESVEHMGEIINKYALISINENLNSNTNSTIQGLSIQLDRNTKYLVSTGLFFQKLSCSFYDINIIQLPILIDYDLVRYKKIIPYLSFGSGIDFSLASKVKETTYVIEYGEYGHGIQTIDLENDFINDGVLPNASLGFGVKSLLKNGGNISVRVLCTYSFKLSNPTYSNIPHERTTFNFLSPSISLSYSFPVYNFIP